MNLRDLTCLSFALCAVASAAGAIAAQEYPTKTVRIVLPGVAGASNFAGRLIAQGLSTTFGQQVIVDGRESGVLVAELVAQAPPDGYTLLLDSSSLWLLPFLRTTVSYDPLTDFSPITLAIKSPNILVVHPSLAAKSVQELIALAQAKPGALNYATGGAGNSNHLGAELFRTMTGINIVRINYKGAAPAISDLIGGQVQLMFATAGSVMQHIKSGRLRALAVTSAEPSPLAPGLPTVASAGLPGYESISRIAMFAPARTPESIINRVSMETARVL